jgi:hypothetical protein
MITRRRRLCEPLANDVASGMAMSKGVKIAVGCAVAFVAVAVLASVGLLLTGIWVKGKVEQAAHAITGEQEKISGLQKQANANPFTQPPQGILSEDRLLKFLNVRKRVFAVYERHRADLEALDKSKHTGLEGLQAVGALARAVNEVRLAQAEGLAAEGMSEAEYRFVVEAVYRTSWAAEVDKATGQKTSEAVVASLEAAAEEAERAVSAPSVPEDQKAALREAASQMRERAKEARENLTKLDAPPENIELFRKHEADIKKYAMSGLDLLGL